MCALIGHMLMSMVLLPLEYCTAGLSGVETRHAPAIPARYVDKTPKKSSLEIGQRQLGSALMQRPGQHKLFTSQYFVRPAFKRRKNFRLKIKQAKDTMANNLDSWKLSPVNLHKPCLTWQTAASTAWTRAHTEVNGLNTILTCSRS